MKENESKRDEKSMDKPDEKFGIHFQGHVKIFDPETKEEFVNKRS
jgi:hypothetical protein